MIFFVANDGTVMESVPSPVYQGAANANDVYLVAPFASNLQATVAFKLPNGVLTEQYAMKLFGELEGVINKQTGKPYSGWQFSMPNEITRYYGVVMAQFFFYSAESAVVIATSSVNFTVGRGVPELLPPAPTADIYQAILANLSALQQQLDNGTFTAKSIYAWNSEYTYGANELVFYPQKGEYGVFLKSLTDDNSAEPYVNGALDTANWLLVSDFNILTELYSLKGDMLDAVQETRDNVAAAEQSASEAATSAQNASGSEAQAKSYADEATDKAKEAQNWAELAQHYAQFGIKLNTDYQSVAELPSVGNPQYIYLIPNGSAGNNSYDEYMWIADKSAYEKIGTTDIDLTGYATKAEVAEKEKTLQSDIDQLYGTTERLKISDSLIHARISEVEEFAETKLSAEQTARESEDQQLSERIDNNDSAISALQSDKVNKSGDTMTGDIAAPAFRQSDTKKNYVDLITGDGNNFGVTGVGGTVYNLHSFYGNTRALPKAATHQRGTVQYQLALTNSVALSNSYTGDNYTSITLTPPTLGPYLFTIFGAESSQHGAILITTPDYIINNTWTNDNNNAPQVLAKVEGEQGYWSRQYLCCSALLPNGNTINVAARKMEKLRYVMQPLFKE
ncbi:MAG: hypothetical protein K2L42_03290 [Clostridia bacterium]|nr:hypothetical protein [Clostridia bacterium]